MGDPDLRSAFLRQMLEMGEDRVVLPRGAKLLNKRKTGPEESAEPLEDAAPQQAVKDLVEPGGDSPSEDQPKWMDGAPPIPGPGMTIPDEGLLASHPIGKLGMPDLVKAIAGCTGCELCKERNNTVPGEGPVDADFMVIGEGPGQNEDEQGRPFVGKAGKLLNDILGAIGFKREDVFIANVVKCRPPGNRNPVPEEVSECLPYLHRQIQIIEPRVILAVGSVAACSLLGTKQALGKLRNKVHDFRGVPMVVTYHPAALLRNPNWKKPTWDDVRIARQIFDRAS